MEKISSSLSRSGPTIFLCIPAILLGLSLCACRQPRDPVGQQSPKPPVRADCEQIHVSAGGSDSRVDMAPDRSVSSLAQAQELVRKVRKEKPERSIEVLIAPGVYHLDAPLKFGPADGGSDTTKVVYRSADLENPAVITGGRAITGMKKNTEGLFEVTLPEVASGKWYFNLLYANGKLLQRARTPDNGYLLTKAAMLERLAPGGSGMNEHNAFLYDPQDEAVLPREGEEPLVVVMHSWLASFHGIKSMDRGKHFIALTNEARAPFAEWYGAGQRYYFENCRSALTIPGEWFLDRKTGVLLYHPHPGETPETMTFEAPGIPRLVEVRADPQLKTPVKALEFRDLVFEMSDRAVRYEAGKHVLDVQAQCNLNDSMFYAFGLREGVIEHCTFRRGGGHGIYLDYGCALNQLNGLHVHDFDGGGIYLTSGDGRISIADNTGRRITGNRVADCVVHDLGHLLHGSHGIFLGCASSNTVEHNEVFDLDYSGIAVGWGWARRATDWALWNNRVEYNHVHHVMNGILSDGGGIYMLGWAPGTTVRGNLIHDVYHYGYIPTSKGVYLDGNSSCMLVEDNLIYNIGNYGILAKGEFNVIARNFVYDCASSAFIRRFEVGAKLEERNAIKELSVNYVEGNSFVNSHPGTALCSGYLSTDRAVFVNNAVLLKNPGDPVSFTSVVDESSGKTTLNLAQMRRIFGPDSFLARPLQSLPTMPATGQAGPRELRYSVNFQPEPPGELAPAAVLPLVDDFEGRDLPLRGSIATQGKADFEVVAEDGNSFLMMRDAETKPYPIYPFYILRERLTKGRYLFAFSLRNSAETPDKITLSFRDVTQLSYSGPQVLINLQLAPDGTLSAAGKQLGKLPNGEWLNFELAFSIEGGKEDAPMGIKVTSRQGELINTSATMSSAGIQEVNWIGFLSDANATARWDLDNLKISAAPGR